MNAPQEKIPRKYTEKEEITLEENLTPEQRLMVCRVFKSVSTKGISNPDTIKELSLWSIWKVLLTGLHGWR
ncbi:hypothetical protein DO374_15310 [Salmonella enterica]|uniref:Uncharacterized protein n=1 Tax=Salmonella enterica TaxID=28901 RepID=A0A5U0QR39_SALER|nr:hypothetical protein [Salmonella enterica]